MHHPRNPVLLGTLTLALRTGFATGETAPQATDRVSTSVEEVVVSATKRPENIQDIPLSVTALSATQIAARGIENFFDYGIAVPNLSFGLGAGDGSLAARGIAVRGVQGANTTGFYIDETPVGETLDPHIVDVTRIEVLRGPQGTLYGAQSMGGTVRIITEQPTAALFNGQARVALSSTEHGDWNELVEGVVNVPLANPQLSLRASGYYQFESGWFTKWLGPDTAPARTVLTDVGSHTYGGGELAIRYEPLGGLTITPRIMYQRTHENGLPYATGSTDNLVQREVFGIREGGTDSWWLASLALNYATPIGTFVSSTSAFDRRTDEREDDTDVFSFDLGLPSSQPIPVPTSRLISLHRFSQEMRFASSFSGPVQLIVGGFYSRTAQGRNYEITSPGLMTATGYPSELLLTLINQRRYTEYAAFADISYRMAGGLRATIGARAYHDTATYNQFTDGLFFGGAPQTYASRPAHDSGITPRYILEYQVTPGLITYVSAAKGFREGGNNPALPQGPAPQGCSQDLANLGLTQDQVAAFRPDTLWSYELGLKSSFFERRFTAHAAGFLIEWSDIQQQVALPLCGYFVTGNSGKARNAGFELELNGRLLPGLTLALGVGYVDARIVEKGISSPQPVGSPVYQVPDLTLTGTLDFEWPLAANWSAFGRLDSSYIGESFSANNGALHPLRRPAYAITDLRFGVRSKHYDISAVVRNATNEHANLADAVLLGAQLPGQPRFLINQPRSVGVDVRLRFE